MTTGTLFNQLKAGKITKEKFLYEVRKDVNLPFISPLTTFREAIQILQNKGIIHEVFEMGSLEETEKCSCGGTFEPHEDAGEIVCDTCGERAPMKEDEDDYDPFYDREEEINYGAEEDERPVPDDYYADDEDDEFEDMLAKHDAEKEGEEAVLGQWDLEEEEKPSLRELVQEFVKNAIKGGSSMDEAKAQAREYFNQKENLNEAAKPKLTVDQVNPYEFKKGVNIEMGVDKSAAPDWSSYLGDLAGNIQKAQAKVLKNLAKDPAYYTNQIAGKHKEKKAPAVKADGYVKVPKSKMEKSNVKTTLSKTERAKGNPQGVKMMKEGAFGKIKEYVSAQLKKEAPMFRSKPEEPKIKSGGSVDLDLMLRDLYTKPFLGGYYLDYNFENPHRLIIHISKEPAKDGQRTNEIEKLGTAECIDGKWNFDGVKADNDDQEVLDKIAAAAFPAVKETKLVKSAKTGETIDVVPDTQAQNLQSTLQKKGVKTTSTNV